MFKKLIISILVLVLFSCNQKEIEKNGNPKLVFPVEILTNDSVKYDVIDSAFDYINTVFDTCCDIKFKITNIREIKDLPYIETLYEDLNLYMNLTNKYDKKDTLSLWVIANDPEKLCDTINGDIYCSRIGGFTYIASSLTNNIIISSFEINERHKVVHEFGHFFGLKHPFSLTGDGIEDTPFDPNLADVYISYDKCKSLHPKYKPMINNFMGYYKYCRCKEYQFTIGQENKIIHVSNTLKRHDALDTLTFF